MMALGILGGDNESKYLYEPLITTIYNIIHVKQELLSINNMELCHKHVLKLFHVFSKLSEKNIPLKAEKIILANNLIFQVYQNNLLDYLSRLNISKNEAFISQVLKINNDQLLELFKVLAWTKLPGVQNFNDIRDNLDRLFEDDKGIFETGNMQVDKECLKTLFQFFRSFIRGDIKGIIEFLWDLKMESEYTLILSQYVYIGIISGWVDEDVWDKPSCKDMISTLVCYPLLHMIYYGLKKKNRRDIREQVAKLYSCLIELQHQIYSSQMHSVLIYFKPKGSSEDTDLDNLLTGKLFGQIKSNLNSKIIDLIKNFVSTGDGKNNLGKSFQKIMHLYLFCPQFYQVEEPDQNEKIEKLIKGAISLRESWHNIDNYYKKNQRNLIYTKPGELIERLTHASNSVDFGFLNASEAEVN
jgi:hypothetical protein